MVLGRALLCLQLVGLLPACCTSVRTRWAETTLPEASGSLACLQTLWQQCRPCLTAFGSDLAPRAWLNMPSSKAACQRVAAHAYWRSDTLLLHSCNYQADRLLPLQVGPANEGISKLAGRGVRFDIAFLDADKTGYLGYYKQLMDSNLIVPGGIIVVDNALMKVRHRCAVKNAATATCTWQQMDSDQMLPLDKLKPQLPAGCCLPVHSVHFAIRSCCGATLVQGWAQHAGQAAHQLSPAAYRLNGRHSAGNTAHNSI